MSERTKSVLRMEFRDCSSVCKTSESPIGQTARNLMFVGKRTARSPAPQYQTLSRTDSLGVIGQAVECPLSSTLACIDQYTWVSSSGGVHYGMAFHGDYAPETMFPN